MAKASYFGTGSGDKVLAELSQNPTARKNKYDALNRQREALERRADYLATRLEATQKSGNQSAYNATLQQLQDAESRINNVVAEMNSISESSRYSAEQERRQQRITDRKPKTTMDKVRESLPYQIGSGIRDMIVDTGKGIGQTALYAQNALEGATLEKDGKGRTTSINLGKVGIQGSVMNPEDITMGDVADTYIKELGKNTGTYLDFLNSLAYRGFTGRGKPDSEDERFRNMIGDAVPRIFGTKDIEDPTVAKGAEIIADPLAVLGGVIKGANTGAKVIDQFGDIAKGIRTADGRYIPRNQLGAIEVWHASPHRFDQFNAMDNIGRGEGAQAYGYGGYHAKAHETALTYQPRDEGFESKIMDLYKQAEKSGDYDALSVYENYLLHKRPEDVVAMINDPELGLSNAEKARQLSAHEKAKDLYNKQTSGYLYRNELRWPDPAREASDPLSDKHFLDWNKPLSQQGGVGRFASLPEYARPLDDVEASNIDGQRLYQRLANKVGEQEASRLLNQAGIVGIRYLDAGSRGAGQGTSNYVTFSDDLVNILERNGVPVKKKADK
jgi:hypothetical protein